MSTPRFPFSSRALFIGGAACVGLAKILACGGSSQATHAGTSSGPGGSASSSSASSGSSSSAGTGGGCFLGATCDGGSEAGSYGCSGDLRSVVDANGAVVMTCPDDQGCSAGACVAACAAAGASKGNVGCDFLVPTPESYPVDLPPCFAVFVANNWPAPAQLTVTVGASACDVTKFGRIPQNGAPETSWPAVPATGIPAGQVAVLFLSSDPNSVFTEENEPMTCPVAPAVSASTSVNKAVSTNLSGTGTAFHLASTMPVSAYDILPYGGARTHFPGATMLMPTTAWGTNYVMIAPPVGTASPPGPLWGQVLATQDNTTVQILPSVPLPAIGAFPAAPAGMTATYTLNAGQYLEWGLPAASLDLSGTVLSSDKPVAAFAGNRFIREQPMAAPGGEEAHAQIPPVSALAGEDVVAPYATRRADLMPEAIPYRVVGAVTGTQLTFDPPVAGAPATIGASQIADFTATGAFHVQSQDTMHPFAIAQVMTTANLAGGTRPGAVATSPTGSWSPMLGDEEFTILLPPAQFLAKYVFFTDPTYPTTNLVLTRVRGANGFEDVTVDCLGTVTGWQPVGSAGTYEVTNVDLLRANVASGTCTNGGHTAGSKGPFGLVVWGEDSYSSYAYPGGGNAATLSSVVVPPMPQ